MSEERVDLAFIGRAPQRLTEEVASLRDAMQVLTAMVQRLDNSHTRLLTEIRATHSQVSRLGDRGRRLETVVETQGEPPPQPPHAGMKGWARMPQGWKNVVRPSRLASRGTSG
jgi:hypothetical protein